MNINFSLRQRLFSIPRSNSRINLSGSVHKNQIKMIGKSPESSQTDEGYQSSN